MSTPATLTASQLDALTPGTAVRCTTDRGRTFLALKIDQGTGRHNPARWNTTDGPATTTQIAAHNPVQLLAAHPAPAPLPDPGREDGARVAKYRALRDHEPRHMGCACGAKFGDSIDARWHLANQVTAAILAALPAPPVVDEAELRERLAQDIARAVGEGTASDIARGATR